MWYELDSKVSRTLFVFGLDNLPQLFVALVTLRTVEPVTGCDCVCWPYITQQSLVRVSFANPSRLL